MEEIRKLNDTTYLLDVTGTVTVSFKLEDSFIGEIDKISKKLGYSNRSDLIREAIETYLKYLKQNERSLNT
ncbi:ribbon-helix-helix domain-containing protein [Sulfuracidifex metallicus]|uniref:ribbon-helix-helix domain-containing protein n=1 Tax=Sulfuracidifex metallicus TaxID=47303 RepID=UPI0022726E86|nr:ribbon-helix-helix domain-containing protein [Sulfuracidifex metallicus]MCY0849832.1 ribbon-helix-helix domain-containing protein [Sulfuracidifex metallicus]